MSPLQLVIPLTTQDDLDKAVELLDRSVHMKSLKILLVLQVRTVSFSSARIHHPDPTRSDSASLRIISELLIIRAVKNNKYLHDLTRFIGIFFKMYLNVENLSQFSNHSNLFKLKKKTTV